MTNELSEILRQLSDPLPAADVKTLRKGGATIPYIPHYRVRKRLNEVCPDWSGEVKEVLSIGGKIAVVYRLTIDGVSREAIGYEDDTDGLYGDPFSNAEAMAFKRAAAWFGLGLYLYDKPTGKPKPQPAPANGKAKTPEPAKWTHSASIVSKMFDEAKKIGLSQADVHLALLVEDVRDFDGTKSEAWQLVSDYAADKDDIPL